MVASLFTPVKVEMIRIVRTNDQKYNDVSRINNTHTAPIVIYISTSNLPINTPDEVSSNHV